MATKVKAKPISTRVNMRLSRDDQQVLAKLRTRFGLAFPDIVRLALNRLAELEKLK